MGILAQHAWQRSGNDWRLAIYTNGARLALQSVNLQVVIAPLHEDMWS